MKVKDVIEYLQRYVADHPDAADRDLLVDRYNGKRSYRVHRVTSVGCGVRSLNDPLCIRIGIDWEGGKE